DDAVVLLDERNEVLRRVPVPGELRGRDFTWFEPGTGGFLAMRWAGDTFRSGTRHYELYRIDESGRVTGQAEATLWGPDQRYVPVLAGVAAPAPVLVSVLVGGFRPVQLLSARQADTYPEALERALEEFWPSLVLAYLLSAALAWLCYRRQVR